MGIPGQKLFDFAAQYQNLSITNKVRGGASNNQEVVSVDVISGATVTAMVVNEAIMRFARKVARILEIAGLSQQAQTPPATVKTDLFESADWNTLTGKGAIRRLMLTEDDINSAFEDTAAATKGAPDANAQQRMFIDLYYAPLNIPGVG